MATHLYATNLYPEPGCQVLAFSLDFRAPLGLTGRVAELHDIQVKYLVETIFSPPPHLPPRLLSHPPPRMQ